MELVGKRAVVVGLGRSGVAAARLLSTQLVGVSGFDLSTQAGVIALLALVALLAVWIPARRATGADPLIALRTD